MRKSLMTFSVAIGKGRAKLNYKVPSYYAELFDPNSSWRYGSADLVRKVNKNNKIEIWANVTFSRMVEDVVPTSSSKTVGVDLGIVNIAVTSQAKFYGGKVLRNKIKQFERNRKVLQKCGSKSAKGHLKRLSLKEKRFRADATHCLTKDIVKTLNLGDTLVLENINGIRKKAVKGKGGKGGKTSRRIINHWAFAQVQTQMTYKAVAKGVKVVFVEPAFTSQTCSRCGHKDEGNRKSQANFVCLDCGFRLNADLNASRNICAKHTSGSSKQASQFLTKRAKHLLALSAKSIVGNVNCPNGAGVASSNAAGP